MTPGDEEVTITHGISTINVITVRDPPPYGHAPTYQISDLSRKKKMLWPRQENTI
jgi:hypothetical protein